MWGYHILREGETAETAVLSKGSWDEDEDAWSIEYIEEHVKKYKIWRVVYRPEGIAFHGKATSEDPGILWIIGKKE